MLNLRKLGADVRRDERGNLGIVFALALVPTVLLVGGAVDVGNVYTQQTKLQAAADAAVLAANMMSEVTADQRVAAANKMLLTNTASMPRLQGLQPQTVAQGNTVSMTVQTTVPTPFLSMMQISSLPIQVGTRSDAIITEEQLAPGKACILALDPQASRGIHIQGSKIARYTDCWAYTNSVMGTAINGEGNSASAIGRGHCAVGGVNAPNNNYSPNPKASCQAIVDPYAVVSAYHPTQAYQPVTAFPAVSGSCTANNLNLKKGTYTLQPGRYCGGIALQAQAKVTLQPGIYIIDNGTLLVQSGSSLSGSNVLFYFSGASSKMTLIGGGTIDLVGRSAGSSHEGFLFISHPDANRDGESNIQGGGILNLEGLLYMPRQTLLLSGNGDVNGSSKYFGMVAKSFDFRGSGEFRLKAHDGSSALPDKLPEVPKDKSRKPYLNM